MRSPGGFLSRVLVGFWTIYTLKVSPALADNEPKQCSIYLAPSSLKGNSGFGVFTTRDIDAGEAILSGPEGTPDGPAIPVVDYTDEVFSDDEYLQVAKERWLDVFGHYWWGRGVPDTSLFEGTVVADFQITFGSLPNHHCVLMSVDHYYPYPNYDDTLADRHEHPGAGAMSYHMGRIFFAQRPLPAGSEIFLNYGLCQRDTDDSLPSEYIPLWAWEVPMQDDYDMAVDYVSETWTRLLHQHGSPDAIPENEALPQDATEGFNKQTMQLLPKTTTEIAQAIEAVSGGEGSEEMEALYEYLALNYATTPREPDWIKENGLCIEHLIPGPSTLPLAGQGGFAQHKIAAGEIVVPVPVLHTVDSEVFRMENAEGDLLGYQLLMNYCLGNPHSSVALCPTTNAILINHCSSRTQECGPLGPNAALRWSTGWDSNTPVWLEKSLEDLMLERERVLALEVVALRDIEPGDEVFIDYGVEFEEAWRYHVEEWQPLMLEYETVEGEENEGVPPEWQYFSVTAANDEDGPLPYLTSGSLREEVMHPFVFTGCVYWPTELDEDEVWEAESEGWDEKTDEELLELFADDGSEFEVEYVRHQEATFWPCSVLYRDDEGRDENSDAEGGETDEALEPTYVVRIHQSPYEHHDSTDWNEYGTPRYLYNFPRSSIRYFPKPYESDQHLPNAFRHLIHIPDDIFPDHWKNRIYEYEEEYEEEHSDVDAVE